MYVFLQYIYIVEVPTSLTEPWLNARNQESRLVFHRSNVNLLSDCMLKI